MLILTFDLVVLQPSGFFCKGMYENFSIEMGATQSKTEPLTGDISYN